MYLQFKSKKCIKLENSSLNPEHIIVDNKLLILVLAGLVTATRPLALETKFLFCYLAIPNAAASKQTDLEKMQFCICLYCIVLALDQFFSFQAF